MQEREADGHTVCPGRKQTDAGSQLKVTSFQFYSMKSNSQWVATTYVQGGSSLLCETSSLKLPMVMSLVVMFLSLSLLSVPQTLSTFTLHRSAVK